MDYVVTLMFGDMQSRKPFRDGGKKGPEYSLLIGHPLSDGEGAPQTSPLSAS